MNLDSSAMLVAVDMKARRCVEVVDESAATCIRGGVQMRSVAMLFACGVLALAKK